MQNCRLCKVELTSENAYLNRKKGKFQTACKPCGQMIAKKWRKDNKGRELRRRKKYYRNNREKLLAQIDESRIRRKYGLTKAEVEQMRIDQNHSCAICGDNTKLVIDHCHDSGNVRSLLCGHCNTGLGMFKDDVEIILKAAKYIKRHQV